jgi:hypothetical protein
MPIGGIVHPVVGQGTAPFFPTHRRKDLAMANFVTNDGVRIDYNDRGSGQPVVFSHG